MSQDTPGTRSDPEGIADGDTNQLPEEDTLVDRGLEDSLDEGYSPPECPSPALSKTPSEQNEPDSLDERERQTNPEVWEGRENDPDRAGGVADPGRSGRLVAPEEEATGHQQDVAAVDMGISGGAASAEEAAVHYEDEGELFEEELETELLESDDIGEPDDLDPDDLDAEEFER